MSDSFKKSYKNPFQDPPNIIRPLDDDPYDDYDDIDTLFRKDKKTINDNKTDNNNNNNNHNNHNNHNNINNNKSKGANHTNGIFKNEDKENNSKTNTSSSDIVDLEFYDDRNGNGKINGNGISKTDTIIVNNKRLKQETITIINKNNNKQEDKCIYILDSDTDDDDNNDNGDTEKEENNIPVYYSDSEEGDDIILLNHNFDDGNNNNKNKRKYDELYNENEESKISSLDSDKTDIVSSQVEILDEITTKTSTTTTTTSTKSEPPLGDIGELPEEKQIECIVCLTETSSFEMYKVQSGDCDHLVCRECYQQYCIGKINDKEYPIMCPGFKCKNQVEVNDLEMLIDEELIIKYQEYSFEKTIEVNPDLFSFCPSADCGYVFFWEKGDSTDFLCPKCKSRYCFKCRSDFHENTTCDQYQQWLKENGKGDQLFEDFVNKQNFKKCPKCQRWVEKSAGCMHIVCRCAHKFCYSCGQTYPCKCGNDPHVPGFRPNAINMAHMYLPGQVPLQFHHLQQVMRPPAPNIASLRQEVVQLQQQLAQVEQEAQQYRQQQVGKRKTQKTQRMNQHYERQIMNLQQQIQNVEQKIQQAGAPRPPPQFLVKPPANVPAVVQFVYPNAQQQQQQQQQQQRAALIQMRHGLEQQQHAANVQQQALQRQLKTQIRQEQQQRQAQNRQVQRQLDIQIRQEQQQNEQAQRRRQLEAQIRQHEHLQAQQQAVLDRQLEQQKRLAKYKQQ